MNYEDNPAVDEDYEFLFRATFEQTDVGIAHVDLDGNILRLNQALCNMLGYERSELLNMSLDEVTHPDDVEEEKTMLRKLLDGEMETYTHRKRYVRKDLEVTWGRVTVNLVRDETGEPQFLVGVVREINEQVEAERRSAKLSTLVEVQQEVSTSELALDVTMQKVARAAMKVTESNGAVVELVEDDEIIYRSACGVLEDRIGFSLPVDDSLSGLAYRRGEIVVCHDVHTDERIKRDEQAEEFGFRSGILVPLAYKNKTFGVLKVTSEKPYYFQDEDEATLKLLSGLLSSQIYHSIQFEDTKIRARTDKLTGINNRRQLMEEFNEELKRADRYDHDLSVIMIDIDHFKLVNDSHGHVTGDRVLAELGSILDEETRSADVVGRYGGEEFIVVTPEVDADGALKLAERIRQRLSGTEFQADDGKTFKVTCSAGVTEYSSDESTNELINKADQALYRAKQHGRNRSEVHDADA